MLRSASLLGAWVLFQETLNANEIISTINSEWISVLSSLLRVFWTFHGKF
jgi:hypothetical protein